MSLSKRLDEASAPIPALSPRQRAALERVRRKYRSDEYQLETVPCYCGREEGLEIATRDRFGLPVRTLLCQHCGLMRTSPRFTAAANRRFYREDYRDLYDDMDDIDGFFTKQARQGMEILKGAQQLFSRVRTVFDIGCGAGGMLYAFGRAGKQVAGCDFNEIYLAYGRRRGLNLVEGNATALLRAAGGPADLVVLSHVVEHFLDLKRDLEEALTAVKPGGFMLIIVPTIETIEELYSGDLRLYLQNAHTYHFSEPTLRYLLETVGLDVHCISDRNAALVQRPAAWHPGPKRPVPVPPEGYAHAHAVLTALEGRYGQRETR